MNLKQGALNKSPAPGVNQQAAAEAASKQRAAAQHQAQVQQIQNANAIAAMQMNQYQQQPQVQMPIQSPAMYNPMYNSPMQGSPMAGAPPPYPIQTAPPAPYAPVLGMMQPPPSQMHSSHYQAQANLHAQATARAGRQRATTMEVQQAGIPPALQRVVSHLDPNAPIRLQPSPAYYPPNDMGQDMSPTNTRRGPSQGRQQDPNRGNRQLIRNLENSTEEGYMMGSQATWR